MSPVLSLLLVLATSSRGLPPSHDLARRYGDAVVTVDDTSDAAVASQGFFVSSSGLLCTVLTAPVVGDSVEVVGSQRWRGTVVAVAADGLVLVAVALEAVAPVAAIGLSVDGRHGLWMVGLQRDVRGVSAVVGSDEPGGVLLPVARGAPVLNEGGHVVAIARGSKGGGTITVIEVAALRTLATQYASSSSSP